jgi:hypothetical protein
LPGKLRPLADGRPRNLVSPDIYAEAFSAAVDFLGTQPVVDRNRIGAIGICGSGSFVISAAKIDIVVEDTTSPTPGGHCLTPRRRRRARVPGRLGSGALLLFRINQM